VTVTEEFFPSGYVRWLGLQIVESSGDRVVATLELRPDHLQPYGIVHGGIHCALIETLASVGAALWFADGQVVGVSNQTDFLRAVREGTLTATATSIHRGRLQQLWLCEIRDADERAVARGQVRLQNLPAGRM
jgi:1,4-dihydroxy-2-naphthoyl-CoA hydrolase